MHFPAFSPNILIMTILLVAGVYGAIGGKHRLRIFILSIYVGIVLAEQMGSLVRPYVKMLGADQVSWLLLGLPILVFGFLGRHHGAGHGEKGSVIANTLVGMLAGALILSSALHLLPVSELETIDGASYFAMLLRQYHLWLLGLLPVLALIFGWFGSKHKGHA